MIIFLFGPDTYRSRQRLKFYEEGFIKKYDPSGFNIVRLNGEKLSIETLNQTLVTPPLLAPKRMIIIENLITKNKEVSRETVPLLENLKTGPDEKNENIIIFWEELGEKNGKVAKGSDRTSEPLFKKLIKSPLVEKFDLLSNPALIKWIKNQVKQAGGQIKEEVIRDLVALVGNDLWQLERELEKLLAYKNKKLITESDVALLVKGKFDEDIFKLTDTLALKNKKRFLELLADQFSSGANEVYLITMLTRLFRILLEIKELSLRNPRISKFSLAEELGLHPFVVEKALSQVANYQEAELKNIYQRLLTIDFKMKTGQAKPRLLFELLAVEL